MSLKHAADKGLWYWSSPTDKWGIELYHPFFTSEKDYFLISALTGLQLQNTQYRRSFEFLMLGFGFGVSYELHI